MTYVVLLKSVATYQLFWPPADRCRIFSIGCIVNGLYYIVVSNPHKYSPKPAHIYACYLCMHDDDIDDITKYIACIHTACIVSDSCICSVMYSTYMYMYISFLDYSIEVTSVHILCALCVSLQPFDAGIFLLHRFCDSFHCRLSSTTFICRPWRTITVQ